MSFFKKTFFLILFFSLFFGIIAYFLYRKSSQSGEFVPPKQTEEVLQLNKKIEATTLPSATSVDVGTYLLQEGPKEMETSSPDYMIYYYKDTGEYKITLLKKPLKKTQKEAESAFLQQLSASGITEKEACLLFVTIGTIASVDEENSGKDFNLSFCPNAKEFE